MPRHTRTTAVAALIAAAVAAGAVATVDSAAFAAPSATTSLAPLADPIANPDYGSTGQGEVTASADMMRASEYSAATTKITRSQVIARAKSWVGIGLDYNWGGRHGGYRTDCSGFVSMAWDLDASLTTDSFEPRGEVHSIGKADLKAGDALLDNDSGAGGHVVLFEKWANSDKTKYWGFDFTPSGVHHRVYDYPYYPGYGPYAPVRYKNIVDDTTTPPPAPVGMTDLVAANINGDAVDDVVGVEASTGKLWLYPGNGAGLNARKEIGSGGWNGMSNLAAGDFTGDGRDDIVATEESSGKLYLYPGNGSGLNTRKEIGSGGWNGMHDLVGGDFTGDGKADIAGVERSTGKLYLYKGNGAGAIGGGSTRVMIGSGGWNGMHDLVGMDIDNDGKSDIVGAETSTGKLFLYKSNGAGLNARKEIGSGGWNGMNDLLGGDFTANAYDDLIGVEKSTGKLFLYPGDGSGLDARKEIGSGGW
ncbi:FG-GAP-like repeat-containing protein [Streptomyces sp. RerS4]|uniref:C40 family peptidase n=1 Tax=Streptomyces sp. RerS4 TaxID=2942449 RepID=UPI00201C516F|nr:FG-GAP-like repeat-containing protein [Streptomyces sp. RerS4]UQX02609.1 FG-GAP-like repeat-containing protein [Streptomyces sp. RerS4]